MQTHGEDSLAAEVSLHLAGNYGRAEASLALN